MGSTVAGFKNSQWGVSGGWSGKINDAGGTSIGIGYNRSSDGMYGKAQQYWAAVVQKVDAAAADVYAGVSYDSGSLTHTVSEAEAAIANRCADRSPRRRHRAGISAWRRRRPRATRLAPVRRPTRNFMSGPPKATPVRLTARACSTSSPASASSSRRTAA